MPNEPQIAKRAGGQRKKPKPFAVWYKGGMGRKTWSRWEKYVSLTIAKTALSLLQRKYDFWEWRLGKANEKGGNHDQVSKVDSSEGPSG